MNKLTEIQEQYLQDMRNEEKKELAENAGIIESFKEFCAGKLGLSLRMISVK